MRLRLTNEGTTVNELLDLVVEAHGGLQRWKRVQRVAGEMSIVGGLWARKGWPEALRDVQVSGLCHEQFLSYSPFTAPGKRSEYTPQRAAVTTDSGEIIAARECPRDSFAGHTMETLWDELHLAYFAGYAMWNYLTTPFIFTLDGVRTREIEPWQEDGEQWRRLHVTFPEHIITHGTEQVFYIDARGLTRRMDYSSPLTGGANNHVAHYMSGHKDFSGIVLPTHRRAYFRRPDGSAMRERVMVAIDIATVEFS